MLKTFLQKHIQPTNYIDPFRLWRSYRAIGEDVPPGGYEDDEDYPVTTRHIAVKSPYITEPMKTEKREKIG